MLTRVARWTESIEHTETLAESGTEREEAGPRAKGVGRREWSGVESGTTAEGPGWIFAAAIGGHGEW